MDEGDHQEPGGDQISQFSQRLTTYKQGEGGHREPGGNQQISQFPKAEQSPSMVKEAIEKQEEINKSPNSPKAEQPPRL